MISAITRKHIGRVFTDIGKYMLTALPFGYLLNSTSDPDLFMFGEILLVGLLFCCVGLSFTITAEKFEQKKQEVSQKQGSRKTIKVLKNATFVVEEC